MSGTSVNPSDDEEKEVTEEVEGTAGGESGTSTEDKSEKRYTEEEWKTLDARMRAADKNRSTIQKQLEEAQAQLAEIEKAKLTDLEKATAERDELKKKAEALAQRVKDKALENAFLAAPGVEWADKEDAFTVLRAKFLEGVEVDDDGNVTGMKEAVAALSKAKPHLVKVAGEEVIEPSSEATGKTPVKRKGEKETADRASLTRRFPALGK